MASENTLARSSDLGSFTTEGSKVRTNPNGLLKNYERAVLRNRTTGKQQEVVLFDPSDEDNEDLLAVDEHFELSLDLKEAFDHFTPVQQRILFRVLMQGLTIEEATRKTRTPLRTWQRWMKEEAMPKLRDLLCDYHSETKEVYRKLTPSTGINTDNKSTQQTVKCKFCTHTVTDFGERALQKLRTHVSDKHNSEFKKIQRHVRSNDRDISRLEEDLV